MPQVSNVSISGLDVIRDIVAPAVSSSHWILLVGRS